MSKEVKRVVKNSFFQTFGACGMTALNFVLMLGYARILGPETFGALVTSQAQVLLWTMLVDLGLSHSLIGALTLAEGARSGSTRQGFRARDLLFRVLGIRLTGAVAGTVFTYLLAGAPVAGPELWQAMAFTPFLFALAFQQTAFAFATYRHQQALGVFANLLGVAATVVLALWLAGRGAGLPWLLLAQSWGGLLSGLLVFLFFGAQAMRRRRRGQTRRIERTKRGPWGGASWRALAHDAWPYAITFGVFVLWQRLDQLAASHLIGLEAGGQYALAVRLVAVPILMASAVSFAVFPDLQRVGRDAPEQVRVILGAVTKILWRYGIVLVALVLVALGLLLVPLVPKFRVALKLLPYFVPGVWAYTLQSFLVNALFGVRRYRAVVRAHLLALALYLPSLYFLTLGLGLAGVVWAFNIFCFGMAVFSFLAARREGLLPPGFLPFAALNAGERALWNKVRFRLRRGGGA